MEEAKQLLVLMIDDDYVFSDVVRHSLERAGMRMERAGNGEDGLLMLKGLLAANSKPDAIILDISMPGLNGIEVLEKIHADPNFRDIPVALLSNFSREEDISWAREKGAVKSIDKTTVVPTDIPDLIQEMIK